MQVYSYRSFLPHTRGKHIQLFQNAWAGRECLRPARGPKAGQKHVQRLAWRDQKQELRACRGTTSTVSDFGENFRFFAAQAVVRNVATGDVVWRETRKGYTREDERSSDSQDLFDDIDRSTWWTAPEALGVTAGFYYSRIGGGNRLSNLEPAGAGSFEPNSKKNS